MKTDKTGAATIDANRYLAGPKWRSMRLQAGVRVFEIELRGPDGETITTLERIWAIRRKPRWIRRACSRSSRESPAYGAKARSGTISPKPCEPARPHGRTHALQSARRHPSRCRRLRVRCHGQSGGNRHQRGTDVDRAAIGTCAKRILEGAGTEGGQDLKRYDKYMKEAE